MKPQSGNLFGRRFVKGRSALLVLVVLSFFMTVAAGDASPILDQSNTTVAPSGGFGCASTDPLKFYVCGQSFTNGLTGTLTQVDIFVFDRGEGVPVAGLYDASPPQAPILLQESTTPYSYTSPGYYSFTFNYPVTSGSPLAFGMRMGVANWAILGWQAAPYSGGAVLAYANTSGYFLDCGGCDTAFRTYVDTDVVTPVPEPTSLLLLGIGLVGMVARRRPRQWPHGIVTDEGRAATQVNLWG